MCPSRRDVLRFGASVIGAGVAGATAASSLPTAAAAGGDVLVESTTVSFDPDGPEIRFEFDYEVPSSITELTLEFSFLAYGEHQPYSVVDTANVRRESPGEFAWTGSSSPRVVLAYDSPSAEYGSGYPGYLTEDVAFLGVPDSRLPFRYRGSSSPSRLREVTFEGEGEGYANGDFVYAGPHTLTERTVGETRVVFVEPDEVTLDVDREAAINLFAEGERHLGGTRWERDEQANFVIPERRIGDTPSGRGVGNSSWTGTDRWSLDRIDNVPAHEYAHTVFGVYGIDEMYWLKEASAEYYGYLVSLNAGCDTYEAFLETVRTDRHRDEVLSNAARMRRSSADYQKGAHVLAALDAEIRTRTEGERALLEIYGSDEYDLSDYDQFVAAAVDVAGDDSMAEWVDRFVRTESIPEVPDDPALYTLGDNSPESFARAPDPTPTPEPTPTATPTAEPNSETPTPVSANVPRDVSARTDRPDDSTPGFGALAAVGAVSVAVAGRVLSRGDDRDDA